MEQKKKFGSVQLWSSRQSDSTIEMAVFERATRNIKTFHNGVVYKVFFFLVGM